MNAFDVRIHAIRRRKNRRRPFEVRWRVAGRDKSKSFLTRALADSYRAELVRAARQGLEFDPATGEPPWWAVPESAVTTWLEHAVAYVDMKWPRLASHSRASLADALATVTLALTRPASGRPPARTLRAALYRHAFNPTWRATTTDPAVARALGWLARASLPVTQLNHPRVTRAALDALMLRLDGSRAAASTIARKRAVFHDAAGYAVELGLLPANPVSQVRWTPPKAAAAVNPQTVASPAQVRAILAEVARLRPELTAFFGCLYYAALRPEEAVALRRANLVLPAAQAGQADPHRRLPAHRLRVDQHRHAARTVLPQAPPGGSGAGRPCPGGSGRPAPAAPARVMDPRRTGGCSAAPGAAFSAKAPTAVSGAPPARSRSARSWPLHRWPAVPMTCGMPPCRCG
jgi:integrase